MNDLRIGTSGWSYPNGRGAWTGIFYPASGAGRRTRVDELAFYAERFDTVEINSSFYGVPRPGVSAGWARRTPPGFEFSLKLHQRFTHPKMHEAAKVRSPRATVPAAGSDTQPSKRADPSGSIPRITTADVDEFRMGIDPIARAGKLGAILAQFPSSFKNRPETLAYLDRLLGWLEDYRVAVELRDRSWSDQVAVTLTLLNSHGAAWTQIDEPKFRFSIRQNYLPNVKGFYYMRLHGRNAETWWRHEHAEDRYDYLYSADELRPFSETAGAARALVKKLYLYLNNHFAAKSVANALMIKHQVGQSIAGDYPPTLVDRYPELRPFVPMTTRSLLPISS